MDNQTPSKKRKKLASTPPSTTNDNTTFAESDSSDNWPRFFVIESLEDSKPLASLSPFIIEKCVQGLIGTAAKVQKLRSGALLIEVLRAAQAENLTKVDKFFNVSVRATAHRSLNSCKGVIRSADLAAMDDGELLEGLSSSGVTAIRHIMQTVNGQRKKSTAIVLTFSKTNLPSSIKAGYMNIKVEPYIPAPLRCFKCQKYGHHQTACRRTDVCSKCGLEGHGAEPCSGELKCVNCSGSHPSFSNQCPAFIREREISSVKTLQKISYLEARKIVEQAAPKSTTTTYASVTAAKPDCSSVGTQTDNINCSCGALAPLKKINTIKTQKTKTQDTQTDEKPISDSVAEGQQRSSSRSPRNRVVARDAGGSQPGRGAGQGPKGRVTSSPKQVGSGPKGVVTSSPKQAGSGPKGGVTSSPKQAGSSESSKVVRSSNKFQAPRTPRPKISLSNRFSSLPSSEVDSDEMEVLEELSTANCGPSEPSISKNIIL